MPFFPLAMFPITADNYENRKHFLFWFVFGDVQKREFFINRTTFLKVKRKKVQEKDKKLFFSLTADHMFPCVRRKIKHPGKALSLRIDMQFCAVLSLSVMSDSLQSHGLQRARLLCQWGSSRQEYWSGLPCPPPGHLPNPEIESRSPTLQVDSLPPEPPGKPLQFCNYPKYAISF